MSNVNSSLTIALVVWCIHGVLSLSSIESRTSSPSLADSTSSYRLPTNIMPVSYNIILIPDMEAEKFTFQGEADIKLKVVETTSQIILHFQNLELKSNVSIRCIPENSSKNLSQTVENGRLIISLVENIPCKSNCTLSLKFSGKDIGGNRGFYRTSYTDTNGNRRFMASTQFEPISARQVFPCWDEPSMKAHFNISIRHNRKYTALSNMPASVTVDPQDVSTVLTNFGPSPPMSTYSVAFAVGEFNSVDLNKYDFQVWSRKNIVNGRKYAREIGPVILNAMENYTDYPYQKHGFRKMDSLAVPELSAGAMENWGLVIYKENQLLFKENSHSAVQKETVATIMAHELAHQWFGNLVTAKWWDEIWLNEGFANYFQYVITNEIQPTWRMMDRFVVDNLQGKAFVTDSQLDTHAIVEKRESDLKIMESFDTITYSKSGSILRTISHLIGEEKFKTGLRSYLKKWEFGSATSQDLFTGLVEVYKNHTLVDILTNWIFTPGYPVVNVLRDYMNSNATITQSRFIDTINTTSKETYWVPINYVTEDNLDFEVEVSQWFNPAKPSLSINLPKKDKFVIFNKQQFGYYRVNYDVNNWEMISSYLQNSSMNHKTIHVLNRAQLIDDALSLAKVDKLSYSVALTLTKYLKKERDLVPWQAAWRGFQYISTVVANTEFAPKFKEYVLKLSENLVQEVLSFKVNNTDHIDQLKRVETLKSACNFGSHLCISQASEILTKWLDNPTNNSLYGDDEKWCMCGGMRNASLEMWNKLWTQYLVELNEDILTALGCTSNIDILRSFINNVIETNKTRDLPTVFRSISSGSDEGVNVVLDYMIEKYKELETYPGYNRNQLIVDFTALGERLTNDEQLQKLIKFHNDAENASKDIVNGALSSVKNNLLAAASRFSQLNEWFDKETPPAPAPTQPGSANAFALSTIAIVVSFLIIQIY